MFYLPHNQHDCLTCKLSSQGQHALHNYMKTQFVYKLKYLSFHRQGSKPFQNYTVEKDIHTYLVVKTLKEERLSISNGKSFERRKLELTLYPDYI